MSRLKKRTGKWSFLIMLFVCGIFYMVFLDPEKIYAKALGDLYHWSQGRAVVEAESLLPQQEFLTGQEVEEGISVEIQEEISAPDEVPVDEVQTETEMPSYRDVGEVIYVSAEDDYFEDALFIGDSRIVGMFEYGGLEEISTFYAETGLTIYRLMETEVAAGDDGEKITVEEALSKHQFGKVYLMVGINELGTGTAETFLKKYAEVVNRIQELQPDAIVYVQGILKVTSERSAQGDYITNESIEERNEGLSRMVDNVRSYYLDINPVVCDETGGVVPAYTYDGIHLKAQYIPLWKEYLNSHVVENVPGGVPTE